jgi:hypothetical protein
MKNTWRDIVARPFMGKAFIFNFAVGFLIFVFIREIWKSNGYIVGGFLSTTIMFFIIWLVGLPYVLSHPSKEALMPHTKPEPALQILKKSRGLKYFAIFTAVLFISMVALVSLLGGKYTNKQHCVRLVNYKGTHYELLGNQFQGAPNFKTYNEAMTFCVQELVVPQTNDE